MASVTLRTTEPTPEGGSRFVEEQLPYTRDTDFGLKTDEYVFRYRHLHDEAQVLLDAQSMDSTFVA